MKKRSITIAGHATSLWLEQEFWTALKDIAKDRSQALNQLVADIDMQSRDSDNANLSSILRVFVLDYYRNLSQHHNSTPIAPMPLD